VPKVPSATPSILVAAPAVSYGSANALRRAADLACRFDHLGCFNAKGIGLSDEDLEDRRKVPAKRAAAGLSIARLINRGLVKNCAKAVGT
jgi:hypothetical protein